jgi:hypothetical protein
LRLDLAATFHRHGHFRDAARVKDQLANALRSGARIALFAEGATTD